MDKVEERIVVWVVFTARVSVSELWDPALELLIPLYSERFAVVVRQSLQKGWGMTSLFTVGERH